MATDVIPTLHARMIRGTTKILDRIFRDELTGAPVDLTGAIINYAVRADQKIDPSIQLTSQAPASLLLGTFGTVVSAIEGGNDIQVRLVQVEGIASVSESLITDGLIVTGKLVTINFGPGITNVASLEAAINSESTLIRVTTPGNQSYVMHSGDQMSATNLAGGGPNGWRTGIVIDPDQDSNRGHFQIILIPSDTILLDARGDDDPWFHEAEVFINDQTLTDFGTSKLSIYPQAI